MTAAVLELECNWAVGSIRRLWGRQVWSDSAYCQRKPENTRFGNHSRPRHALKNGSVCSIISEDLSFFC
jgi:hypothetical protein